MKFWIFLLAILLTEAGWTQTNSLQVTADFREVRLTQAISQLEDQYPVHFFFDSTWADTVTVSYTANQVELDDFIDGLLRGTGLHYYIGQDSRITLTERKIIAKISQGYFAGDRSESAQESDFGILNQLDQPKVAGSNLLTERPTIEIGNKLEANRPGKATISGYLKDSRTGEPLIGAQVFLEDPFIGTSTDPFGYYLISLSRGKHEIIFRSVGMKEVRQRLILNGDGQLDLELIEDVISLKEVVVLGERNSVDNIQTGTFELDPATLKSLPTILGDADVMKIALTLPGVQAVGEGASGFNVRGGATDQNLILVNDAVVFNPTHLFGFFSAFNPDAIKSANLYKSGIQAQYGGRVSSVFDVAMRDGNKKKFTLSGGISPITARITAEGPLTKDKTSYLLGIRSTYSDWILRLLDDPAFRNSQAYFGDIIAKVDHQINSRNSLTFSAYHSRDNFKLNSDSLYQYYNSTATMQWRHSISNRLFSSVSGSYSNYSYRITSDRTPENAFQQDYAINNINLKVGFDWLPGKHNVKFGLSSVYHNLSPGTIRPDGENSIVQPVVLNEEKGFENALFIGDEFEVSHRLSLYGGLRLTHFSLVGPGTVNIYQDGVTKDKSSIIDTVAYGSGEVIKAYYGPEFRFSARYKLTSDVSIKASYDRTRQYIHQLSNSSAISPTDIWRLSNTYIKPQIGDQFSVGLYKNFEGQGMEASIEGYYKEMNNLLEYKDGANLLINELIETEVIGAFGKSYGAEFLVRKKSGKLNGWLSYTYSRVLIRAENTFEEEILNDGDFFPASYDKPHNLALVTNYKINRRINFSINTVYSTGRPVTIPIAQYQFRDNTYAFFSDRNQLRIPDYFRLDLAINLEGNHKVNKLIHGSWSFSVYNLTGRNNAYSIFFRTENGNISVNKLSIFAEPIPTITYNFKFQ